MARNKEYVITSVDIRKCMIRLTVSMIKSLLSIVEDVINRLEVKKITKEILTNKKSTDQHTNRFLIFMRDYVENVCRE